MRKAVVLRYLLEAAGLPWYEQIRIDRLSRNVRVERPVFVVGACRSGTSVFNRYLCDATPVAFFTRLSALSPRAPVAANRLVAPISKRLGLWWNGTPNEAEPIWSLFCPTDEHCLTRPASAKEVRFFRSVVRRHLWHFGRERFLNKCVRHIVRLPWLLSIFPDAQIVHIIRDGRAVARSIRERCIRTGRDYWGTKPGNWRSFASEEPIVRAGLQWKALVLEGRGLRDTLGRDRYHEVRYEEFLADPHSVLSETARFCDLVFDPTRVDAHGLDNRNLKWREELGYEDHGKLLAVVGDFLEELGYEVSAEPDDD